jgi:hypothetical protein
MTVSEKKYRKRMSPKSGLGEKIIEYGILGLIIFSPLPAASVHEWSILVIQLAVVVMMIAYFMMKEQPETNEPLSYSMRWPGYLFIGLFIFIFIQVILDALPDSEIRTRASHLLPPGFSHYQDCNPTAPDKKDYFPPGYNGCLRSFIRFL